MFGTDCRAAAALDDLPHLHVASSVQAGLIDAPVPALAKPQSPVWRHESVSDADFLDSATVQARRARITIGQEPRAGRENG